VIYFSETVEFDAAGVYGGIINDGKRPGGSYSLLLLFNINKHPRVGLKTID
jgi:hypothetical protein